MPSKPTLMELGEGLRALRGKVEESINLHIEMIKATDIAEVAKVCERNVGILIEAYLYVERCIQNLEKRLKAKAASKEVG